ncbi:acyl-CoA dehydrogenase family protein [Sphingobium aromaticiconvertens]|uniref:acyl-CoA dehydrogenase family protein n=1 Tax=Sphingobium aromaticiconvertens TaxID=365341 RepID=UPI0030160D81
MDFQYTEDQEALVSALQSILQDHAEMPQAERFSYSYFSAALQGILTDSGFLDAGHQIGALEAALVVAETAKLPVLVEASATGLVAPMVLPGEKLEGPVALVDVRKLDKAHRNLTIARTVLVDMGEDVAILPVEAGQVEPVKSIYGYPYGRFATTPDLASARHLRGQGAALRQWWRVAIAIEIAAASMAAIDFTVDYVKQRHVFGKPIGAFQAVQHRLVQCKAFAMATHYLAMRAAWSGEPGHADFAACHAQQGIQKLLFDLHQFHGGMGVTTEHLLHFWTYRVRALQAEAGGVYATAIDIAGRLWSDTAPPIDVSADTRVRVA